MILVGLFLLPAACSQQDAPARPDIVVIAIDTLRADRLASYGCAVDTAPFLTELAGQALVFENAWSPSSWTLPATLSVFTSTHPFQHGVTQLDGLELGPDDEPVPVRCLPDQVETLAEVLGAAGYRTYGVVSNLLVGSAVGADRGFDRFVKLDDEVGERVNAQLAVWRDELHGDGPSFVYLHYIDPHDPFHAREPWFDLEATAAGTGWPAARPVEGERALAHLDWMLGQLDPGPDWLDGRRAADLSADEIGRVLTWMRAAYDSEIGYVDARIREVFETLDLDDAVVVLLADHGEEFYEHGDLTHGANLHGETVRVPLLLRLPGEQAQVGRVATPVSTLDILPTLRRLAGLPASRQDQGTDLLAPGARPPVLGTLEAGRDIVEADMRSLVVGDHRLIVREGAAPQLYDVAADPLELRDLAVERPELVAELSATLQALEAAARPYPRTERLPPEAANDAMREHLRGIGYMGDR